MVLRGPGRQPWLAGWLRTAVVRLPVCTDSNTVCQILPFIEAAVEARTEIAPALTGNK